MPWSFMKKNPVNGELIKDSEGNAIWEGYCIEFIDKLAEEMNFEYDLVIPADGSFGNKLPNGKWTGLVGDLARGVSIKIKFILLNNFSQLDYVSKNNFNRVSGEFHFPLISMTIVQR